MKKLADIIEEQDLIQRVVADILDMKFSEMRSELLAIIEQKNATAGLFQGIEMVKGAKGDTVTGPKGDKGDKGDSITGPQGITGLKGEQGIQGENGAPGINGAPGSPDTGEQVVDKVNNLPLDSRYKIDIAHIKGFPKEGKKLGGMITRGGANNIYSETLAGTNDGVNAVFTFLFTPKSGTERVFVGGPRLSVAAGDYTISSGTITFTNAPPAGQPPLADYERK